MEGTTSDPRWHEPEHPLWRALLATCALLTVLPLWTAKYLPFTDLAEHVSAMGAIRHYGDPSWHIAEHFSLDLAHTSYSLYYLAGAGLSFVFGTAERANLVLLSATAVCFPLSLRALCKALGRDERLALFGCTLFWNQSLLIGFFNYLAALPMLVWALALVVRQLEEPTRRRAVILGVLGVALFYLHLSAVLFFVPATALAAVHAGAHREWRSIPRRFAWLAPVLVLGVFWVLTSSVANPDRVGWQEPREVVFEPIDQGLSHVPGALLDIWYGPYDEWCFLGLLAAGAAMMWPAAKPAEDERSVRARSLVLSWLLLAALCYFAIPQKLGWLWQLNERYAILAALVAPAILAPPRGWRGGAALAFAGAIALVAASNATLSIHRFQDEVGPFDAVVSRADPGKRMLVLIFEQRSRWARFSPFLHFGAFYRARGGGVIAPSFADLPQSPLQYRAGMAPPARPYGWEWEPWRFQNDASQRYFDYVLVRGPAPSFDKVEDGAPEWKLVTRSDRWALYSR